MKSRKTFLLLLSLALLFTYATTVPAAGIIRGKISALGSPGLPNVKVVAYDHDFNDLITGNAAATGDCEAALFNLPCPGDKHDKMGQDFTDANGNYLIQYNPPNRWSAYPGHWDNSFNHQDTRWRPDIFIEVYIPTDGFCEPLQNGTNKWRFAGRSHIVFDWPTDTDLTMNVMVPELVDLSCGTFGPLRPYTNALAGELRGWVDMHAHPMAHLAFGGILFHGAPDVGALMAPGTRYCGQTKPENADGMMDVLASCDLTHMFWAPDLPGIPGSPCGDILRFAVVNVFEAVNEARFLAHGDGFQKFQSLAPTWNDLTHQHMWIDWIYRAYRGGQRVMVALAVNSRTLAYLTKGPLTDHYFDKAAGDLQITEMKRMVSRHPFMEIAYSPAQLRDIVRRNKLAVVLGLELDDFGDFEFNKALDEAIRAEIDRQYNRGVRYIFPVHLTDNRLGATAAYNEFFNVANFIQNGKWWALTNAPDISFCFDVRSTYTDIVNTLDDILNIVPGGAGADFRNIVLRGLSATDRQNPTKVLEAYVSYVLGWHIPLPDGGPCDTGGHVNANGLTKWGETAIKHMMARGMMIDIDHMSRRTVEDVIDLTEPNAYPLNSGHNGYNTPGSDGKYEDENNRTWEQYTNIARRGGMAGMGTGENVFQFMKVYTDTMAAMKSGNPTNRGLGLGTDINGMQLAPAPPPTNFALRYGSGLPRARTGLKEWNYNVDGVAHYGILPDYLVHVGQLSGGKTVLSNLFGGAEAFALMWEKCLNPCSKLSPPVALSPACGTSASSTAPWLQWSSVPNQAGYIVRIFNGATCSGTPIHTSSRLPADTNSYPVDFSVGLRAGGIYSWQVQAKGDGSAYCDSQWSACCSFVVSPFIASAGAYHGLFYDTNNGVMPESSGFFQLTLMNSGSFTGYVHSVTTCGSNYFNGTFDPISKMASVQLPPPLQALMTLELKVSRREIIGTISASGWQAHVEADRRRSTSPATNIQGRYTMIIPADPLSQSGPDGDGYGTLSLGKDARVNFTGRTADNVALNQVVPISTGGDWPLFACLYGGGGSLMAWMKFSTNWQLANNGASWTRPSIPTAGLYPAGFSNQTVMAGSRFVPPGSLQRILNIGPGKVVFSGGNLPVNVTNWVSLSRSNTVVNQSTNFLSMTINTNAGTFQGSFRAPGYPQAYNFRGAVLQSSNAGWGYFWGTNKTGRVYFGPRR